jgi:Plasmid replication region DNA-binding N-term
MSNPREATPEPKASRVRVFEAADRILRSGRRPTVEAIRELLGGGSPNSVTAYIHDWYQELGSRLVATEEPLVGFPREAVSLMAELWRIAAADRGGGRTVGSDDSDQRAIEAAREGLLAQNKALEILNHEMQRHRASAERSLAEARALLSRREGALEVGREKIAELEMALATARMELEVAAQRRTSLAAAELVRRRIKRTALERKTRVSDKTKNRSPRKPKPVRVKNALGRKRKVAVNRKSSATKRRALGKGSKKRGSNSRD